MVTVAKLKSIKSIMQFHSNVQGTDITNERNVQGTDITNERNVQGTDITSEKNVQILYTQNQSTVQVFTKPVYSTCIHRICTGMEFNQQ